jgi:5-methylcytosine-specific restriction endonuclease McrA
MTRPLYQLVKAEKYILQLTRDQIRYREWERRGKVPLAPLVPPKQKKPKQKKPLLKLMIETQNGVCILCNQRLVIDFALRSDHPDRPSFDHVVSKAKGGQDRGNRIAVHRQCNSIKSNRDPTGCELIWLMVINNAITRQEQLFIDKRVLKQKGN